MEIRKLSKSDQPLIEQLLAYYVAGEDFEEPAPTLTQAEKLLDDDRSYLFAAVLENRAVGYVLAYRFPYLFGPANMAYLYDIEVFPEYREQGIGRQLIQTLVTQLKTDGVTEMWLGTAVDNVEAQGLFKATGGTQSGETFYDFTFDLSR